MAVERAAGGTSLIDVLDRVLDKGIVIDAWVRVSLVGIDLITVEARVVVASIDTYLKYSEAVGQVAPVSRPATEAQGAPGCHRGKRRAAGGAGGGQEQSTARRSTAGAEARRKRKRVTPRLPPRPLRAAVAVRRHRTRSSRSLEFLLTSIDLQASARRAVDWLVAHAPASSRRSVAVVEPGTDRRCCSSPSTASPSSRSSISPLSRDDTRHPLVAALERRRRRVLRRLVTAPFRAPIEGVPFHAIPLRGDDDDPVATACCSSARSGRTSIAEWRWVGADARPAGRRGCSAVSGWPRRDSARSGCCSTASSTPSPTRSC